MTCGDPSALVATAEQAAFELRLDDAQAALEAAEAAFGCAPVDDATLARFFDVEGARAGDQGDLEAARLRFRAARDLEPDGPDPNYGKKIASVSAELPRVPVDATIDLNPRPERNETRVDAEPVTVPLAVTSGLHLVQVGPPGSVAWGELVLLEPGATLVLSTRLTEAPPVEDAAPTPPPGPEPVAPPADRRRRPSVPLLVTSGAMAALGGVAAGLALHEQNGSIPDATSVDAVDAAWARQRAFGWTAYGLWGGAAVVAGVSFF